MSPSGAYPVPETSRVLPFTYICLTVISFWVRVPVLSEQITLAQPRVSTDGSFLIRTFRFTMRCTPNARAIVTIAGSPSGMAATARLTEVRNASSRGLSSTTQGRIRRLRSPGTGKPVFSKRLEFALEWGLFFARLLNKAGNLSQFGLHAR